MEKQTRVRVNYRLDPFVYSEMKKILEKIKTTETNFVEIAIIEKMARIREFDDETINNTKNDKTTLETP